MTIEYKDSKRIVGLSSDRTQGLKAYYHFEDNGTNAQTTNLGLGSSADMTVTGATYVTGKVGSKAISFDGTNDYAVIGSSTSDFNFLANTTHEWTVAFWFKNASWGSNEMILSTSVELGSSRYGLGIRAQSSGSIYVHFSNGTNQNRFTTTQTGFSTDGNWHFIVITAKKSDSTNSLEFWEDGTSLGTASNSGKDFVDTNASQAPYIGQAGDSSQYLDGDLDELSIWNRRLSDSEIATLYNSGTGIVIGSTDIAVGDPLTNVQDNSLLIEKDTANRYWFTSEVSNLTFEDDFSNTWSTVGTGSNGTISINGDGGLFIDTVVGNSDTRVYKALGFTMATDWTARWEQTMKGTTDNNVYMQVMNFTAGNANLNAGTSQDSVHMITDSNNQTIYVRSKDGSSAGNQSSGQSLTTNTKYYMEFVKDGTDLTLKIRTESHSGTLVNTLTTTCTSGVTGLTHIQTGGATGTNSGAASYIIDNMEIWNNSTSATGTATYTENFSDVKIWQEDGDDVVMGTNVIDWAVIADGNDDLCYKDLTSVDDSKWVADFDITFDTVTSGSSTNGSYLAIYLDSATTSINTAGHDGLGITYELDNSPSNQASIGAFAIDNKNPYDGMKFNSGTGARSVFTETAQASETQYVRMMRDESTFTVKIYSDSARQTLVESQSVDATNGGTVNGLRYFKIATGRDNTNDHTFDGKIDNVKFYNGVSTPTTWNEDMTGVTSALTVDNFTIGTSTQSSSTGTESHTISASSKEKKILLVTVRTTGVDSTQSSCTYAGVAMTNLGTAICGTGNHTRQTCFYLLNPPTGTADIVVTKSNSGAHCKIIALSLYGAKQSAPTFAINAGSFSPSSGITTNITPPANSWVYSTLSGSSPTNSTNDPPSTYYTNAELTVLNSDTSVTKKKYGLKKDPTTGSNNAVQMYFKHSANNNNQPVAFSVFAVEPLG